MVGNLGTGRMPCGSEKPCACIVAVRERCKDSRGEKNNIYIILTKKVTGQTGKKEKGYERSLRLSEPGFEPGTSSV